VECAQPSAAFSRPDEIERDHFHVL
jgi:hypothetical protein